MTKLTKIVATIGPASESETNLTELINAGLNVARFNTKHNEPSWHDQVIKRVKKVAQDLNQPIAVLLDLQGPEIRIDLPDGQPFDLAAGEEALVTTDKAATGKVILVPEMVVAGLSPGNQILLDDGACELTVVHKTAQGITVKAEYPCTIKTRKTMNTPGVVLDLPSLTERDFTYLEGVDLSNVDYVGLSFVRNAADITFLQNELDKRQSSAKICAKIENQAALDNLDEIIEASASIMVARGDLAVETPFEQLAHWQRLIIAKSRQAGKPVITATQMLHSMITKPRPSRAEISDVAHAVYDGTDAVMLSEESAMGQFPAKAVQTQAKIAAFTEAHPAAEPFTLEFTTDAQKLGQTVVADVTSNKYLAIVCSDPKGDEALQIARMHLPQPLFVLTDSSSVASQLSLAYGVIPIVVEPSVLDNEASVQQIMSERVPATNAAKQTLWISGKTLETKVI